MQQAITHPGFIISPEWIIPVIPNGMVLSAYSVVVQAEHIIDLLPTTDAVKQYAGWPNRELPEHMLTPGMINAHGHAAMTLLRGYADDTTLMDWLNHHIWPVENRWVSPEFVYDGTSLAIAEMIRTGTTCAIDSYFFPDAITRAFIDHGFRAQVCMPIMQFDNAWAKGEDDHIEKALECCSHYQNHPLITTAFAPHSPYVVTDQGFEKIVRHTTELSIPIHLHLHETEQEVLEAVATSGQRPIARMQSLGVISPLLQAVHMTQLTEAEMTLMANHNAHVVHCPDSNLKLASGICPITKLAEAGVNIALGTDGAASNNNLDMLAEMRSATLLAKGNSRNAGNVSATEALAMATINSAKMLGLADKLGSIEVGKFADCIAIDLSGPGFQPVHQPLSQLVYGGVGYQVQEVWIHGKQQLHKGEFVHFEPERIVNKAQKWRDKIQG